MKIAIISDIHDNQVNLEKVLNWCRDNKIEVLLGCGDMASNETMEMISKGFPGPVHFVKGNMCFFDERYVSDMDNITYHGTVARVEVDGKWIGLCHQPYLLPKVLEKGSCDIVFYGHTHKPWEEVRQGVQFVNPGTLAGMFMTSTFAVYDTSSGELELKLVDKIKFTHH